MNRCKVGAKVSAYRLGDSKRTKRIVGTLAKVSDTVAVIVADGKRINCAANTLKRARKIRHNEYRFGNRIIDTHTPIVSR